MGIPFIPLPFATDHPQRKVPYVTYAICALNILVFSSIWHYALTTDHQQFDPFFLTPWEFSVTHPNLITLFTHAFIHVDPFHLLGNLLIFWLVGRVLEDGLGSLLFTLVYFASLVMATLLYGIVARIFLPDAEHAAMIGASGAISGVMGMAAFRFYRLRVRTVPLLVICCPLPIPVQFWLPFWAYALYFAANEIYAGITQISNITYGVNNIHVPQDNVAHWAHIGGLLLGVLAAFLLDSVKEGKRGYALEDAAKAVSEGIPANANMRQLERISRERPDDPEVLEAMAALAMAKGDVARSCQYSTQTIGVLLKARETQRAALTYLSLVLAFPQAVLPVQEQLAVAYALESMGHYREAAHAFKLLVDTYPQSRETETALLRAAQLHQRHLHDYASAKWMLQSLLQSFPASPWETLARERLREIEKLSNAHK